MGSRTCGSIGFDILTLISADRLLQPALLDGAADGAPMSSGHERSGEVREKERGGGVGERAEAKAKVNAKVGDECSNAVFDDREVNTSG